MLMVAVAFSALLQLAEPSWIDQVVTVLVALLAIPGASSLITGALRYITDNTGLNPRTLVYIVSLAVTAFILVTDPPQLPAFVSNDPAAFVTAWLLLATGWAEFAKSLYDKLLSKLPIFNPAA